MIASSAMISKLPFTTFFALNLFVVQSFASCIRLGGRPGSISPSIDLAGVAEEADSPRTAWRFYRRTLDNGHRARRQT